MTLNVFYRKSEVRVFGDFSVNGINVQIHVLYNTDTGGNHCPGVTTIELYKTAHDGGGKFYKNRPNAIVVNSTNDEAVKEAINNYFKATIVDVFQVRDSFDE